jgi:protein phosphatase
MPWSAKAQDPIADHYARVGAAAAPSLELAGEALSAAIGRGIDLHELQEQVILRREAVDRYAEAYRRYCWPVQTVDDLRLAPFHVLATEARVHADETHEWHMEQVDLLAKTDAGVLVSTQDGGSLRRDQRA